MTVASASQRDELLLAFDRLFGIGALYPSGHARCQDVARIFRDQMRCLLGAAPALVFEAERDSLVVQAQPVAPEARGARRLAGLFATLGISRLEIDAQADPAALQELVRLLLRWKHEADSARGFRQLDLTGLPSSTRIVQRELAVADEETGGGQRDQPDRAAVARVLQTLRERGGDDPASQAARGGAADPKNLLEQASAAIALAGAQPAELLLEALQQAPAVAPAPAAAAAAPAAGGDHRWAPAELEHRLQACAPREAAFQPAVDGAEHLSVLLQLLLLEKGGEPGAVLVSALSEALREPPDARGRAVLAGALADLLPGAEPAAIDTLFPVLAPPLRRSAQLAGALRRVCERAEGRSARALWSHVVNEILLGLTGDKPTDVQEVARWAASREESEMRAGLPRLAALEALRDGRLAPQLFQPPSPALYPLFAVLLGGPRWELFGPPLRESLRAHPPRWIGSPVLLFLQDEVAHHRGFLSRLLHELAQGRLSETLSVAAGRIIAEGLRELPASRRRETGIAEAVGALGSLPAPGAGALLKRIRRERRWLVKPAWPRACRDAAARAQRRPAAEATQAAAPPPPEE